METRPNDTVHPERKAVGADGVWHDETQGGLTKREHFVGMAFHALLSRQSACYATKEQLVTLATEYADALIAGINK